MPIGFNRGDASSRSTATRPRSETTRPFSFSEPREQFTEPRMVWLRWITAADERTCPQCAPLEGTLWREGDGPEPPLHAHCRCVKVVAWVEVGMR